MADNDRVAVYLDFDNIVISRYDQAFGAGRWRKDNARDFAADAKSEETIAQQLAVAQVDVGAIIDYASSFGTVMLSKAYADWSVPANAAYRRHLTDRAVDLVQLFALGGTKNGADIRLAVDVMEDLARYPDLTHVVIVAGDSDYVPLAQRAKQLSRYVVGIGVTGSTGRALVAACDTFSTYDDLPDVKPLETTKDPAPATKTTKAAAAAKADPHQDAGRLLVRATRIVAEKADDDGWAFASNVKQQMQRMDAGFKEKSLGFSTFRGFLESFSKTLETRMVGQQLQTRVKR